MKVHHVITTWYWTSITLPSNSPCVQCLNLRTCSCVRSARTPSHLPGCALQLHPVDAGRSQFGGISSIEEGVRNNQPVVGHDDDTGGWWDDGIMVPTCQDTVRCSSADLTSGTPFASGIVLPTWISEGNAWVTQWVCRTWAGALQPLNSLQAQQAVEDDQAAHCRSCACSQTSLLTASHVIRRWKM